MKKEGQRSELIDSLNQLVDKILLGECEQKYLELSGPEARLARQGIIENLIAISDRFNPKQQEKINQFIDKLQSMDEVTKVD